jgi:hypothetical protein
MSTGHKIFTEDNICKSIGYKQVLQTPSGGQVGQTSTSKTSLNNYVKGIMAFINVTNKEKTKIIQLYVEKLFKEKEDRKRKLTDRNVRNKGHFKKKS